MERDDASPALETSSAPLIASALQLLGEQACGVEQKIAVAVLKEMWSACKVFEDFQGSRKVTIFGSARTRPEDPLYRRARTFARRLAEEGFMVITGGGPGIMAAAQEGAGRNRSFGLSIQIAFEQAANDWIAQDPKLIIFKYFFTRKLFLVKEADAVVLFPGGLGTLDEGFEILTLIQTGKTPLIPVVLLDHEGGTYWRAWREFVAKELLGRDLISPDDLELFEATDSIEAAVSSIRGFYANYHSMRPVGEGLLLRVQRPLPATALAGLTREFAGGLRGGEMAQLPGPLPEEGAAPPSPGLTRILLPFDGKSYGQLRRLLDRINAF